MMTFLMTLILSSVLNAKRTQFNQIIDEVNNQKVGWTAELSSDIDYDDESSLVAKLGAIPITEDEAQSEMIEINK